MSYEFRSRNLLAVNSAQVDQYIQKGFTNGIITYEDETQLIKQSLNVFDFSGLRQNSFSDEEAQSIIVANNKHRRNFSVQTPLIAE